MWSKPEILKGVRELHKNISIFWVLLAKEFDRLIAKGKLYSKFEKRSIINSSASIYT